MAIDVTGREAAVMSNLREEEQGFHLLQSGLPSLATLPFGERNRLTAMVHDEMAAVLIKSIARNGNTPERTSEASHLIPDLRKAENFFDDAWDTEDALAVRINLLTLMRFIGFTDQASQHDDEAKAEALLDGHPELDLTLRIPFYHNLGLNCLNEGRYADAQGQLLKALDAIERLRRQQADETLRRQLFSLYIPSMFAMSKCLIKSEQLLAALQSSEQAKARTLIDRIEKTDVGIENIEHNEELTRAEKELFKATELLDRAQQHGTLRESDDAKRCVEVARAEFACAGYEPYTRADLLR